MILELIQEASNFDEEGGFLLANKIMLLKKEILYSEGMSVYRLFCKLLCAFGVLIYFYKHFYNDLLHLRLTSYRKFGKPILILVGLFFYEHLIFFLDYVLGLVRYVFPDANINDIVAKLWKSTSQSNSIWDLLGGGVLSPISTLFIYCAGLVRIYILIKRALILCLLTILGLLSITFTSFENFKDSFPQWLQKYVSVSLWLPVMSLVNFVFSKLIGKPEIEVFSGGSFYKIFYALAMIIAYLMIPQIADWIVAGGGGIFTKAAGATRSARQGGGMIAKGAKMYAKFKTGGMSGLLGK